MSYKKAVDWLFTQIPNYQKQGGNAYKPGLETISNLLEEIGNPHHNLKIIHIAGTNGKGSVSHILSAALQNNGFKVGLFTSPHIKDFRERIKVNGKLATESFVEDFVVKIQNLQNSEPSFFEITTAMAFDYFASQKCDFAVIETGLGGRLDSTNVVSPEITIITNIGLDHQQFLGNTIEKIATEKGGIIKVNCPLILGDVDEVPKKVLEEIASEKNASVFYSPKQLFETDLIGQYQQRNLNTAHEALMQLKNRGYEIDEAKVEEAFKNVTALSAFHGRMYKIGDEPLTIADAAHNPAGISNLMQELNHLEYQKLKIVFGASNDKDVKNIFALFPKDVDYYFTTFDSARSLNEAKLKELAEKHELPYQLFNDSSEALKQAQKDASVDDLVLVCGSFFLLEKII